MANASQVPDVTETDLERSDLEEAARELGIDGFDDLEDQELFERIGVALGEIDLDELEDAAEPVDEAADDASDEAEDTASDVADDAAASVDDAEDEVEAEDDEDEDDAEAEEAEEDVEAEEAEEDVEAEEDEEDDEAEVEDDVEAEEDDEDADDEDADDEDADDEDADDEDGAEPGEYRFEDDPREGIEPILDLEAGPVALDVFGVEIHLRRVHAVLTANPNGGRNIIGKLLAQVATAMRSTDDEEDTADEEESADEESNSDDGSNSDDDGSNSDDDESNSDDHDGGLLNTIAGPARGLARGAKRIVGKD
jgi:hypothetical protein